MLRLYRYDPLDRLTAVADHQRFYNQARLATEIQGSVPRSVFQVGDHVLAEAGTGGSNLLATDLQRSVLHAVNPDKTRPIVYNAYGHRPAESGVASVLGFNGERADPVTGHYLLGNGYRAFNPVLMRFNSPDSWSPFGRGGINSYGYAGGDPVNRVDPSGHFWRGLKKLLSRADSVNLAKRRAGVVLTAPVKPSEGITYLENLRELIPDVHVGRVNDLEGTLSTLLVTGHGGIHTFETGKSVAYMVSGAEPILPQMLSKLLYSKVSLKGIKEVNLAMCHSGDLAQNSFAQQFASFLRRPVTGYVGVIARREPVPLLALHAASANASSQVMSLQGGYVLDASEIIRDGVSGASYNPIKFLPR